MTTATGALPRTPLGELTSFHQTLAVFKGSVSQLRRKGRMDRAGGKEMEEKNGETGEGMEYRKDDVDFGPSCKNLCGRLYNSVCGYVKVKNMLY